MLPKRYYIFGTALRALQRQDKTSRAFKILGIENEIPRVQEQTIKEEMRKLEKKHGRAT